MVLSDGSSPDGLQVVAKDVPLPSRLGVGDAVCVEGHVVPSRGANQAYEMVASALTPYPGSPHGDDAYPLQKKEHSPGFLRSLPHLRGRTSRMAAVLRTRSRLATALESVAQDSLDAFRVHTPLLTSGDCEGGADAFAVAPPPGGPSFFAHGPDSAPSGDVFLTVSGQLEAEAMASGLGNVYTFGPTFRAENSNTSRHLSEFWMLEPELFFVDTVQHLLDATTALVGGAVDILLSSPRAVEDLRLLDPEFEAKLNYLVVGGAAYEAIEYTTAVEELQAASDAGIAPFDAPPAWGDDLSSEHEAFIVHRLHSSRPTFVTHYPASIKPFYMLPSEASGSHPSYAPGPTVAAFDLLLPGVGEVAGGSLREHDHDRLKAAIVDAGLDLNTYQWYLDLRKYGSAPHGGFGLGFDRLVQFVTASSSIRDVIPFPRHPGCFQSPQQE